MNSGSLVLLVMSFSAVLAFAGGLLFGLFLRHRSSANREAALEAELGETRGKLNAVLSEMGIHAGEATTLRGTLDSVSTQLKDSNLQVLALSNELSEHKERNRSLQETLDRGMAEREESENRLRLELSKLTNELFTSYTNTVLVPNKGEIGALLQPFENKLLEFRKKIDEVHVEDVRDRQDIRTTVLELSKRSDTLSEEANNLTHALVGRSKNLGTWGEAVLTVLLTHAGLQEGIHYTVQKGFTHEDSGKRVQPDVIVHLPDNRHLVVDSKVSLPSFLKFSNATDEEERSSAIKALYQDMKNHVEGLSKKRYDEIYQITSPDFVLMFVPIEPAFNAVIQYDESLYGFAMERHIAFVTPSTLLGMLRIIENIWKQEKQNRNVKAIAEQAGGLYDLFVSFVQDLQNVGAALKKAEESHESALKRLSSQKGNLVRRVEVLKDLGAKAKKALPPDLLSEATESFEFGEDPEESQ